MGMTGSWHIYGERATWRKPRRLASLAVLLGAAEASGNSPPFHLRGPHRVVCFTPKTLELLSAHSFLRHPYLTRLGPDLLARHWDENAVLRRFRQRPQMPIGVAVMDQSLVCGIGNVYKSELLFLTRISPFVAVCELEDDRIVGLLREARRLMRKNLAGQTRRRTRFAGDGHRLWAYRRSGQPCLVCGQLIQMRRQGDLGRSTYWCPRCQAA
jgi:endonuclease-8